MFHVQFRMGLYPDTGANKQWLWTSQFNLGKIKEENGAKNKWRNEFGGEREEDENEKAFKWRVNGKGNENENKKGS